MEGSSSSVGSTLSTLPYGLFLIAVPYLATTRNHRWWLSTAATLGVAWLLMVAVSVPAMYLGTSLSPGLRAAGIDTYFVVAGWPNYFLKSALLGIVALAILSFLLGGTARYLARSSAA